MTGATASTTKENSRASRESGRWVHIHTGKIHVGRGDTYQISAGARLGLYTILPLPIYYSMHCNKGSSGGNTVLRNSVGDEGGGGGGGGGAQTKGGCES